MSSWDIKQLTTTANTVDLNFSQRTTIMTSGTYGGGNITATPINTDSAGNITVGNALVNPDGLVDGSNSNSFSIPAGQFRLTLTGSTGATVSVWIKADISKGV